MVEERRALKLSSPSAGEPIFYDWPLMKTESYDAGGEIIESIRFVCEEHKELNVVMEKVVKISRTDTRSYDAMRQLCEQFSRAADTIRQLWTHATRPDNPAQAHATARLLKHVVQQCYNRSVAEPAKLNHYYDAFSPETYGETSFSMMEKIVGILQPTKKDVFLDLGSGVGQVVLYMSGGSACRKVIGIEKADLPANYANTMQKEFHRWMKWYGKTYRNFELIKGNFLDAKFRELILKEATIIFVNNYAFGPDLDHKLKKIFAELRDGVRIISSRSFCNSSARLSDRMMNDLTAMMDVEEIMASGSSVSWTCKAVPYFIHTVNRSRLETYFFAQKAGTSREVRGGGSKSSSKSSSRESSRSREVPRKSSAQPVREPSPAWDASAAPAVSGSLFGPTTRRQWNEWVSQTAPPNAAAFSAPPKKRKASVPAAPPPEDEDSGSGSADADRASPHKKKSKLLPDMPRPSKDVKAQRIGPGRPRKSDERRVKTPPDNTAQAIQLMHEQTIKSTTEPHSPIEGCIEVADLCRNFPPDPLSSIPLPRDSSVGLPMSTSPSVALDFLMKTIRQSYEAMMEHMKTDEFKAELLEEISKETARKEELSGEKLRLERQVESLKAEGVGKLKMRMTELQLGAGSPAELLEQSKEIVERHQQLQLTRSALESDVERLEAQQRSLLTLAQPPDTATLLKQLGISDAASSQAAKEAIFRDISAQFRRQKSLVHELSRIQADVMGLQANLPPQVLQMVDSVLPAPPVPVPQPAPPASRQHLASSAALPPAPPTAARGAKRPRAPRTSTPRKRATAPVPPRKEGEKRSQEEIERQIQDIVAKALSVDSAAKSAEKERRQAKSGERKGRGKAAVPKTTHLPVAEHLPLAAVVPPTVSRPAAAAATALPLSATFSSPGLVPVFVGEAKNAPGKAIPARSGSGSSAETESLPSDGEVGKWSRPASLPHPLLAAAKDAARATSLTPTLRPPPSTTAA